MFIICILVLIVTFAFIYFWCEKAAKDLVRARFISTLSGWGKFLGSLASGIVILFILLVIMGAVGGIASALGSIVAIVGMVFGVRNGKKVYDEVWEAYSLAYWNAKQQYYNSQYGSNTQNGSSSYGGGYSQGNGSANGSGGSQSYGGNGYSGNRQTNGNGSSSYGGGYNQGNGSANRSGSGSQSYGGNGYNGNRQTNGNGSSSSGGGYNQSNGSSSGSGRGGNSSEEKKQFQDAFDHLSAEKAKELYHVMSKVLHPDSGGDEEAAKNLNEAYAAYKKRTRK